ncbi:MAG TPA: hypothetical protein VGG58_06045 [Candidatus Acidoferrum sp.]
MRRSERSELSSGAAFPNAFTYAYAKPATELLRTGTTLPFNDCMVKFEQFNERVGLPKIRASEERYFARISKTYASVARKSF